LSHQTILQKIIKDKSIDYALVLEDDANLDMASCDAQDLFAEGMRSIREQCSEWGLIYLGGCLSTFHDPKTGLSRSIIKPSDRLNDIIIKGKQMYQTHAYLIRRTIARDILERLKSGQAADAALASWCRQNEDRCFSFHPRPILRQEGGSSRWKDSDIFAEGEVFKANKAKTTGKEYAFAPKRNHRALKRKKR